VRYCRTIVEVTRWIGRQWTVVFGRVWNGVRIVGGSPAPAPTVADGPLRGLAEALNLRHTRSIATIAEEVNHVCFGTPGCASLVADLTAGRVETLRAMERGQPLLGQLVLSDNDVAEERVHCRFESSFGLERE
jgi:hypothetical protein